jgi:DNA-binding response OmpR family regulator
MPEPALPPATILVVEDDPAIAMGLRKNLGFEGYGVLTAPDAERGWELVERKRPDLVILDVGLPRMSGFELCKLIRARCPGTGIIILSARGQEVDRIMGLDLGADDYLSKPFSVRELLARVQAVLRRRGETRQASTRHRVGEAELDVASRRVRLKGKEVPLSSLEFDLLLYLVRNPDRVLSRDEILNRVWGHDYFGTPRTVDNVITKLRQKLETERFQTVRGVGYRFEGSPGKKPRG